MATRKQFTIPNSQRIPINWSMSCNWSVTLYMSSDFIHWSILMFSTFTQWFSKRKAFQYILWRIYRLILQQLPSLQRVYRVGCKVCLKWLTTRYLRQEPPAMGSVITPLTGGVPRQLRLEQDTIGNSIYPKWQIWVGLLRDALC